MQERKKKGDFSSPPKQVAAGWNNSLFLKEKPNKPNCIHLPWKLEKKGELEKNKGGRSYGRRRSLDLSQNRQQPFLQHTLISKKKTKPNQPACKPFWV